MKTNINGQDVDCDIAYGNCHQVVRDYAAFEIDGEKFPANRMDYNETYTMKLPWFKDFRKAVQFLESKPWTGHIQTYVMKEDESGPSWITNGVHYHKKQGDNRHPSQLQLAGEKVFCVPGKLGIVDMAIERDGILVAQISKETIEELAIRYPGVVVDTMDEAIKRRNNAMRSPPEEITKERFFQMLEILPPMGWINRGITESFKMCEFTCGSITGIYVRIEDQYFHLSDIFSLSHEEIIAKVKDAFPLLQDVVEYFALRQAAELAKTHDELIKINEKANTLYCSDKLKITDGDWVDFTRLIGEVHAKLSAEQMKI